MRTRTKFLLTISALAVLATPAIASAATASTTISSVVSPVISLTSGGTVNANVTPTSSGVQTIASDTVSVSTNDSAGYTLTLQNSSASTGMASGGNTIAASTGTQTTPIVQAVNTWGYRVDNIGGFGAGPTTSASNTAISGTVKFAGVPATGSPNTIATSATTATNATTTVWYGVTANTSQPSGTYTSSVTYTATAN